jgi:hypothetical protein
MSIQLNDASIDIVLDERDLAQIDGRRWSAEISPDVSPLLANRLAVAIYEDGWAVVRGTASDLRGVHLAEKVAQQLAVVSGSLSNLPS